MGHVNARIRTVAVFASASALIASAMWSLACSNQAPAPGAPPRTARNPAKAPESLARYFPSANLLALVEFDGLGAHSEAWSRTAAHAILAETPTGTMLRKLAAQLATWAATQGASVGFTGDELVGLIEHLMKSGFAFGIARAADERKPSVVGLVVRDAANPRVRELATKMLKALVRQKDEPPATEISGRQVNLIESRATPGLAWWFEGSDLVVCLAGSAGAERMIACLEGKTPDARTNEHRQALAKADKMFIPAGWAFFDMTALPPLPEQAVALGLGEVKRLDFRWGFEGKAIKTVLRIDAPAPRSGVLALLDQPGFRAAGLPPLPGGIESVTAVSFDADAFLTRLLEIESRATGRADLAERVQEISANIQEKTGLDLRKDILEPLGPTFCLYSVPTPAHAPTSPILGFISGMVHTPKTSLLIELKNADAYADMLDRLMPELNKDLKLLPPLMNVGEEATFQLDSVSPVTAPMRMVEPPTAPPLAPRGEVKDTPPAASPDTKPQVLRLNALRTAVQTALVVQVPGDAPNPSDLEFRKLKPPLRGWALSRQVSGFPLSSVGLRPTILVGKKYLAISTSIEAARDALSLEGRAGVVPESDALASALASSTGTFIYFNVSNTRDSLLPEVIANLPSLVELVTDGGGMVPLMGFFSPLRAFGNEVGFNGSRGRGPAITFDADELPTPQQIRRHLFPAVYTMSADERGFRFETTEPVPMLNPLSLAPLALAAAFPVLELRHEPGLRAQSTNNLKQILIAFHNFHDTHNRFPADIRDKDGKLLLSWRVEILPFLDQQALFEALQKDEAWDSPHNKALLASMPAVFAIPGADAPEPGFTFYRGFSGPHAIFDPEGKPTSLFSITDGTSNTIAVVEASEAVPWTKPGSDIPFDGDAAPGQGDDLRPMLGGHFADGFNAAFCDGAVRFLRSGIEPRVLRALITRDMGEVASTNEL